MAVRWAIELVERSLPRSAQWRKSALRSLRSTGTGAATREAAGGTRVALTGGVRVPSRTVVVPLGVRREARRSLDLLEQVVEVVASE